MSHLLGVILSSLVACSSPLAQEYPANDAEWEQAFDAIDGGIALQDAVMPADEPIRHTSALLREIWESVSETSWNRHVLYHIDWQAAPLAGDHVVGVLSDGTPVSYSVTDVQEVFTDEVLEEMSPDQQDLVAQHGAVAWLLSGEIASAFGSVSVDVCYFEYIDGEALRKVFTPFPGGSGDNPIFRVGPTCSACVITRAMQQCLDEADRDFRKCRRFSAGALVAGIVLTPWTGGAALVGGVVTALANQSVCAWNHADDVENCIRTHSARMWIENGYYHWELQ